MILAHLDPVRLGAGLVRLLAGCLMVAPASAAAVDVAIGNLSQVYDGTAKVPSVTSNPTGLTVDLAYRNLTQPPTPVSSVVFNNSPDTLALSYSSLAFAANKINGIGNYLRLGGSSRKLELCDVTMVTWAKAENYPTWAAANPNGYYHPVTLTLYRLTDTKEFKFLTEVTRSIFVPWRPLTLPDGSAYPYNGYAFRASFDFPNGITLPEKVLALVSYSTQSSGFQPIGSPGPFNELNVALTASIPSVGSDADPGAVLKVIYDSTLTAGIWSYPNTSLSTVPMLRLRALSTETTLAPVNAGSHEVTANVSDSTFAGKVVGTLVIAKAPASVQVGDLTLSYDGLPKQVVPITTPPGLAVSVTYNGSATPPTDIGFYTVSATVTDPNYTGSGTGTLTIGGKSPASIELTGLNQTYDGASKAASATTMPTGLAVVFTYDGSPAAPTNPGTYAVVATIEDANYTGTASGNLVISKAAATVTLGDLAAIYDGTPKHATATTSPDGLAVSLTYDGSTTAPTHAGTYAVVATIQDAFRTGMASGNLVIGKAVASVHVDDLAVFYDGTPKSIIPTMTPPGLAVAVTYNGSAQAPSAVGSYNVSAQVTDPDFTGGANGQLIIKPGYQSWIEAKAAAGTIPPGQTGTGDDPDGDGTSNLLEYAFNLDPGKADAVNLTVGANQLAGLPGITLVSGPMIQLEFIRRKASTNPDITYTVQFGSDLTHWENYSDPVTPIPVDGTWERVRLIDFSPYPSSQRFARVLVSRP